MALVLAALVALVAATPAWAASITINRDSSYDAEATGNTVYTYYKILDAVITEAGAVNASTGELTTDGTVVYTVDTEAKATAIESTGLFDAKLAADGKYYVTLKSDSTTAEAIAAALDTMVAANATLFPGTEVESAGATTTISGLTDGYYFMKASNGSKLAVQTLGEVTINEKNPYPGIDKQQKKANGTWTDDSLPAEIGTYVDYKVEVTVPGDANKPIQVVDKMSAGLEFDTTQGTNGLTVTPAAATYTALASTDSAYDEDATWQIKFDAETVESLQGQTITITYRAKITDAALVDTGKENEVTLDYDNGHYVVPDQVDYEIYFAGIYKVDPNDDNAELAGVKFDLKDGDGAAVNVTYNSDGGYYVVDPTSTSNEVETRLDGDYYTIKIRGLDNDKTYTLTETETVAGYNLLEGTVTLTKVKDEGTAFADKAANTFDRVENNKGTQLPSTGGMGTRILYTVGGIMLVGGAIALVSRKRVANMEK